MVSTIRARRRPVSEASLSFAYQRMGRELIAAGDVGKGSRFLAEADKLRASTHGSSVKLITKRTRR
jgi:hypothetical protein